MTMPSRIPVRIQRPPDLVNHTRTVSAPTRLERLAAAYQQKLHREKQRKLVEINQIEAEKFRNNPALRDYHSAGNTHGNGAQRGLVREFFQERKALEKGHINNQHYLNNINYHYHDKKASQVNTQPIYQKNPTPGKPPLPQNGQVQKRSAGRDKASPLAPLNRPKQHQRRHSDSPAPDERGRKPHRRNSDSHAPKREHNASPALRIHTNGTNHSPKPPPFESKPKLARGYRRGNSQNSGYTSGSDRGPSPPMDAGNMPRHKALIPIGNHNKKPLPPVSKGHPSSSDEDNRDTRDPDNRELSGYRRWRQEQEHKRQGSSKSNSHRSPDQMSNGNQPRQQSEKLTDFQKWQMEQDKEKEERLQKYSNNRQKQKAYSPVNYDDETSHRSTNRTPASECSTGRPPIPKKQQLHENTNNQRERRKSILQNTRPPTGVSSESEEEDDPAITEEMKQKQAQLEALISKQQRELENLRKKRELDDQMERKEEEKRAKRIAAQEKRLRREREAGSRCSSVETAATDRTTRSRQNSVNGGYENSIRSREPSPKPKAKPPPKKTERQPVRQPTPDNENTAFYLEMANTSEATANVNVTECPTCGRKFADDRIAKHKKVCNGKAKKRKVFDPTKMRTQGTDMAQYVRNASDIKTDNKPKKNNWRTQHENFIKNIRYAKQVTEVEAKGGSVADLPPPPVTENPDYKQCPHCSRRFNPTTAERHIPKCKDIKARPAPPKQKRR